MLFVEAEMRPAGEEAGDSEKERWDCAEEKGGEEGEKEKESWKVLDADGEETAEDGDGVFGYELFEGDEEGDLQGDSASNRLETAHWFLC